MKRSRIQSALLRKYRQENELTQKQFAAKARLPALAVSRAENDEQLNPATLKKIAEAMGLSLEAILAGPQMTEETYEAGPISRFPEYAFQLRRVFGSVDFKGLARYEDTKSVDLDSLYVVPQFADAEVIPEQFSQAEKAKPNLVDLTPKTLESWGKRVVMLAGMGTGKSIGVRYLALQFAAERRNDWRKEFHDPIPLPIVLRELKIDTDTRLDTWADFLDQLAVTALDPIAYLGKAELLEAMKNDEVCIMLDGLDEVPAALREKLHAVLWKGMRQFPGCRWIATSRIQGYGDVPLNRTPEELRTRERQAMTIKDRRHDPEERSHAQDNPTPRIVYLAPFDDGRIQAFASN